MTRPTPAEIAAHGPRLPHLGYVVVTATRPGAAAVDAGTRSTTMEAVHQ